MTTSQPFGDKGSQPLYFKYDPKLVPRSIGFVNNSACCWWNSLLQVLLALPSLNNAIINSPKHSQFAKKYKKFILSALDGTLERDANLALLDAFIEQIKKKYKGENIDEIITASNQSVDEALVLFIDALSCEDVGILFRATYNFKATCNSCGQTSVKKDDTYHIEMFDVFANPTERKKDFIMRLRNYRNELESYTCYCGQTSHKIFRYESLCRIGEIIVVLFNKYQKKYTVYFPQTLEFPAKGGILEYHLIGIIEHFGDASGGHYWCERAEGVPRNPDKSPHPPNTPRRATEEINFLWEWSQCNDQSVKSISVPEPNSNVAMLFYHLM
jgi:hypothetical protein